MTPQELANRHDQISESQTQALKKTMQAALQPTLAEATALLDRLVIDEDGKVAKTKENRALLRKAINLFTKKKKLIREEAWNNFAAGKKLIELNIENYIIWQKENGQ